MGQGASALKKVAEASEKVDRDLDTDVNRRLSLSVHHQAISDHEGDDCPIMEIRTAAEMVRRKSKGHLDINPQAEASSPVAVLAAGNVPGPKQDSKAARPKLQRRKSVRDRWKDALKMIVASRRNKGKTGARQIFCRGLLPIESTMLLHSHGLDVHSPAYCFAIPRHRRTRARRCT